MDAPLKTGSETFRRLDAFMSESQEEIVETRDWLPLLTTDDWRLLESLWGERPAEWRVCLVCIVGEFPGPLTSAMLPILRLGIADSDDEGVAINAAYWLCQQMLDHPGLIAFDRDLIPRFRELLRGESSWFLDPVRKVLRLHGEAE